MKKQIEAFGGDQALVSPFLNQDLALLTKIDQLTQNLPYTTAAEIGAVFNAVSNLKGNYDTFLINFMGNIRIK